MPTLLRTIQSALLALVTGTAKTALVLAAVVTAPVAIVATMLVAPFVAAANVVRRVA